MKLIKAKYITGADNKMNMKQAIKSYLTGENVRIDSVGNYYISDDDFPQTYPVVYCEKCGNMVTGMHDVIIPCPGSLRRSIEEA